MRVLRNGTRAVLVELDDPAAVLNLYRALRREPLAGTVQLVPAARTLMIELERPVGALERVNAELASRNIDPTAGDPIDQPEVVVPVHYDGPDLAEVARHTGLSPGEVVARHVAGHYTVGFCGFAPGFAYLTGMSPALRVPRRETPRTRLRAGSVGLADVYTGVYPRELPGGWQIIGHTSLAVWQPERDPPALLTPATRVRFVVADRPGPP